MNKLFTMLTEEYYRALLFYLYMSLYPELPRPVLHFADIGKDRTIMRIPKEDEPTAHFTISKHSNDTVTVAVYLIGMLICYHLWSKGKNYNRYSPEFNKEAERIGFPGPHNDYDFSTVVRLCKDFQRIVMKTDFS